MSDKFHRILVEDASRIDVPQMTWKEVRAKATNSTSIKRKRNRWVAYVASASALAIIAVGVSGFVSPVMAATLRKIPIIGALYSFEMPQMNQYATTADPSVTDQGITVSVPKAYYDGHHLDVIYKIQVPKAYKRLPGSQISSFRSVKLNGKPLSFESLESNDALASADTYSGNVGWNLAFSQLPKSGALMIPIDQIGAVKGHWTLFIPVSDISVTKATHTNSPQGATSIYEGIIFSITKVSKGPVWTTMDMRISQPLQANGQPKYEMGYLGWSFLVTPQTEKLGHIGYFISQTNPQKMGHEEVWDVSIQSKTPSSGVKLVTVRPSFIKSSPNNVEKAAQTETGTSVPQLDIIVPLQ